MEDMIRAQVIVSGRVQGVFFRQNTLKKAKELAVFGWVRNLMDGRVEVVFEGEKGRVERMVDWLKQGPVGARVEHIEIDWQDYRGEFKTFEIRY